jgi:hypothetical protein
MHDWRTIIHVSKEQGMSDLVKVLSELAKDLHEMNEELAKGVDKI